MNKTKREKELEWEVMQLELKVRTLVETIKRTYRKNKVVVEQITRERDDLKSQLKELGYGLGEKTNKEEKQCG